MRYHHHSTFAGDGVTHAECRIYTETGGYRPAPGAAAGGWRVGVARSGHRRIRLG
jgi:hypothetical protein